MEKKWSKILFPELQLLSFNKTKPPEGSKDKEPNRVKKHPTYKDKNEDEHAN
ncbi:hypothetical protein [Alkalihalobacillus trypoxylicola]|uniref:hypothetical protein n=1 Tax=Alkalihalobacillus trypoxylicola TaxID=519424 RepID=UPI000AC39FDF|nr:hypothetical protein [Alkalihalobacillus trypoxylicola]